MLRILFAAAAIVACAATGAAAQPLPAGGVTAPEIVSWLSDQGLEATVREDAAAPAVASGANGVSWDLNGFDCQAGRCASWQFSAGFLIPAIPDGAVERWNLERRYLKAFEVAGPQGLAAVAQYDVLLTPGMTWEAMTEHMRLFASVAPLFAVEMGAVAE